MGGASKPAKWPGYVTECPCCGQSVQAPPLQVVSAMAGLSLYEHRVLAAIWGAAGQPVRADRIIDAVWYDDIDGGPDDAPLQVRVLVHRLRRKLVGTGVRIGLGGQHRAYNIELVQEQEDEQGDADR